MKDIILYLLGLPGIFFVLFLIASFYLFTKKYSKAKTVSVITLVTVLLLTNVAAGKFLASFLIEGVEHKTIKSLSQADMIVMPTQGVDFNGSVTGWTPNSDSFKSATISYFLQAKLADRKVPVLMCGGKMEESGVEQPESKIIKNYFASQTTQIRKTLTEDISKNLYEQAWQCSSMLKRYNAKNPILVINELKMFRTLALFRARGVEMVPFPVFAIQKDRSGFSQYLPSVEGLMLTKAVIREYIELGLDLINQNITIKDLSYKKEN